MYVCNNPKTARVTANLQTGSSFHLGISNNHSSIRIVSAKFSLFVTIMLRGLSEIAISSIGTVWIFRCSGPPNWCICPFNSGTTGHETCFLLLSEHLCRTSTQSKVYEQNYCSPKLKKNWMNWNTSSEVNWYPRALECVNIRSGLVQIFENIVNIIFNIFKAENLMFVGKVIFRAPSIAIELLPQLWHCSFDIVSNLGGVRVKIMRKLRLSFIPQGVVFYKQCSIGLLRAW